MESTGPGHLHIRLPELHCPGSSPQGREGYGVETGLRHEVEVGEGGNVPEVADPPLLQALSGLWQQKVQVREALRVALACSVGFVGPWQPLNRGDASCGPFL